MASLLKKAIGGVQKAADVTASVATKAIGVGAIGATKQAINGIGTDLAPLFTPPVVPVTATTSPKVSTTIQPVQPTTVAPEKKAPTPPTYGNVYRDSVRQVPFSDQDLQTAKKIIYAEVSNRTPDKQQLEAKVILNTALNRVALNRKLKRGAQTLAGVLTEANQYQGYDPNNTNPHLKPGQVSQYNEYTQGKINKQRSQAIDAVLSLAKAGKLQDNTDGAFYYAHKPDQSIAFDDNRPLYAGGVPNLNQL